MKLGVFAPAASCLLPELIGPTRALDLLISGVPCADAAARFECELRASL